MKEIFDLMREQISDTAYCEDDGTCGYCQRTWCPHCLVDRDDLDKIITEAEAKWKEDCCEWVPFGYYQQHSTMCGRVHAFNPKLISYEFCPYCGKRIKIAEVE